MVPTSGDTSVSLHAAVSSAPRSRRRPHLRAPGPPGALTIALAAPPDARVAASQRAWVQAVEDLPAVVELRADAHAHLLEVARVLAWSADWATRTTRPTWERLCERTGLSRRSVARWLAWLRAARLLGVVETGSTPELRPRALAGVAEGNRAALYVLTVPVRRTAVPPVDESGTPSCLTGGESPSHARDAAEASPLRGPDRRTASTRPPWRWTEPTTHGRSRLGCVRRLQERVPVLRRLTDRHLRHLLRPWLLAGWTAADVAWAIDHAPDGTARTWTTEVRSVKGWLAHRLEPWRSHDGAPLRPPSAAAAAVVEASRVEQREARAAAAARAADLEVEHALTTQLRSTTGAADAWTALVALVTARLGRRRPGAMSEALARAAVRAALSGPIETATPDELVVAVDDALALERGRCA